MLNLDKPLRTADGRPARIICRDFKVKSAGRCLLVAYDDGSDHETTGFYLQNGQALNCYMPKLENVPRVVKRFIGLTREGCLHVCPEFSTNLSLAWVNHPRMLAIKEFEIVEGEGVIT